MKHRTESASNRKKMLAMAFFFLLAGCADTPWPGWLTGEPGESVLTAPRAVARPKAEIKAAWPNLGDVPSEKPEVSTPQELIQEEERLRSDQFKAEANMERIRNIPIPEPLEGTPKAVESESVSKEEGPSVRETLAPFFALRPQER